MSAAVSTTDFRFGKQPDRGETGVSDPPQRHIDNCREIASSEGFGSRTIRWIGGRCGGFAT